MLINQVGNNISVLSLVLMLTINKFEIIFVNNAIVTNSLLVSETTSLLFHILHHQTLL